ncbi:MAG: hypothetical protein AAGC66_02885 [Leifsonia sp.]
MENPTGDETWSLPAVWLAFMIAVMAVLTFGGISILGQTIAGRPGPPLFFMVVWFAALGWNVYWWLFRIAYRVDLVDGVLTWRAPLARGSLPVNAIDRVGRFFGAPYTCWLRANGHRSVVVFTQLRSFDSMLRALNQLNPAVPPGQ